MLEQITNLLNTIAQKATKLRQPIQWLVFAYLLTVTTMTILVIVGWCVTWIKTGIPNIALGLSIIHELDAPAMVAFITFIAGCFVDLDGDGIPDVIEKKPQLSKLNTTCNNKGENAESIK